MAASSTAVVELGFAEPPEGLLTPDTFPSKLGGKPAWLNPVHVLSVDRVRCGMCARPMALLLQLYTPEDYPAEAFHRTVYIFICKNGACHKSSWPKSVRVFRSQLPKDNGYWPIPSDEGDEDQWASELTSDRDEPVCEKHIAKPNDYVPAMLCVVCGLQGSKICGKCNKTRYCSREHQIDHWTIGMHKFHCGVLSSSVNAIAEGDRLCGQVVLFPELEVVNKPESDDSDKNEDGDEDASESVSGSEPSDQTRALVPIDDEAYENTKVNVDKAFLRFQKRINMHPDQMLRYARLEYDAGKNTEPLWVSDRGKPIAENIVSCPHCGAERAFEFQILSTILNHLNIDHTRTDALDWGTLLVYTCKDSCHVPGEYYIEELVWRQDFTEEGVELRSAPANTTLP